MERTVSEFWKGIRVRSQIAGALWGTALLLVGVLAGCNADLAEVGGWGFESSTDGGGAPDPEIGTDVSPGSDTVEGDSGRPGPGDVEVMEVRRKGWYRETASSNVFSPVESGGIDDNLVQQTAFRDGACRFRFSSDAERWRTSGIDPSLAVFSSDGRSGRALSYMSVRGILRPAGPDGFDGRLRVQGTDLQECQTSLVLRNCVVPRDSDRCKHVRPTSSLENTLDRYRLALRGVQTREARVRYVLQLRPESWGPGQRSIEWRLGLPGPGRDSLLDVDPDADAPWYYQKTVRQLDCSPTPQGEETCEGLGRLALADARESGTDVHTVVDAPPRGWIRILEKPTRESAERVRLSVRAEFDEGGSTHVWGTFRRTGEWEEF